MNDLQRERKQKIIWPDTRRRNEVGMEYLHSNHAPKPKLGPLSQAPSQSPRSRSYPILIWGPESQFKARLKGGNKETMPWIAQFCRVLGLSAESEPELSGLI